MRPLPLFAVLTVLAGCATPGEPTTLTDAQQQAVKAAITAQLRDPDSVRFGSMAGARTMDGVTYVCGLLNARNGYGGYAGMAPFTGYFGTGQSTFKVNEVGTPDNYGAAMISGCRSRGVPI